MLTSENYFSQKMSQKYLGVSQYKDFVGTLGMVGCESMALAKIRGDWKMEMTTPLLVGSYVDAHFSGTLNVFKAQNPEILKKDGTLKATFVQADEIIERLERDDYFMKFMSGRKQVIMTGELFGAEWKIMVDSLIDDVAIVDLKVMASLSKAFWTKDFGHMSFVPYWGYTIQGAVYQKIVEINTGKRLPFYIAGASKEKVTDLEIISIPDFNLDDELSLVEPNIERIKKLKNGELDPTPCGTCDHCRHTKILHKPVHFSDLTLNI